MRIQVQLVSIAFLLSLSTMAERALIDRTAVALLKSDLAAFTRETTREIHVFNQKSSAHLDYKDEDWSNPDNETSLSFLKGLQEESVSGVGQGMVGPGLYAASDSYSSGKYTDLMSLPIPWWITHRIKVPKGTKMLDIRSYNSLEGYSIPISNTTMEYLAQYCPEVNERVTSLNEGNGEAREGAFYRFFNPAAQERYINGRKRYNLFHINKFKNNPECFQIWNTVIKELDIGMITYSWDGSHPKECDGNSRDGTRGTEAAFLLIDVPLNKNTVDTFTSSIPKNLTEEQKQDYRNVHYLTNRNRYPGVSKGGKHVSRFGSAYTRWEDQFGELGKERKIGSPEEEYLMEHKFGCSKKYEKDDAFQYDPNKSSAVLLEEFGSLMPDLTPCFKSQ